MDGTIDCNVVETLDVTIHLLHSRLADKYVLGESRLDNKAIQFLSTHVKNSTPSSDGIAAEQNSSTDETNNSVQRWKSGLINNFSVCLLFGKVMELRSGLA